MSDSDAVIESSYVLVLHLNLGNSDISLCTFGLDLTWYSYTIPIIHKIQSLSLHIYIAYDINCKETNMIPLNEISYSKLSIPILD